MGRPLPGWARATWTSIWRTRSWPFLALARTESRYTCPVLSGHLRAVAWVVEQFLPVRVELGEGPPWRVSITPGAASA